jgi:hypothetical protein
MMTTPTPDKQLRLRRAVLIFAVMWTAVWLAGCTSYRDPRAEVIITSSRDDATVYLVPIDKELKKPLMHSVLKEYNMGSTSSRRSLWVQHGYYWLVLEKNGAWSEPVEFEIRLDHLNKVHVDF